ncbi:Ribosomal RNA small subunit methyltransferase G [Candidatus Hepatincola sp. Av]
MPIYLQKLQHYVELITFWQTKFNLVSKNSVTNIWERHILDSLQLLKFITPITPINLSAIPTSSTSPTNCVAYISGDTSPVFTTNINANNPSVVSGKIIFDLGSGAGFPSVVLAIMDSQNTYYAIESNSKKCVFLQYVKRELKLDNFIVVNTRIENFILQQQVSPSVATQDYQALKINESKVVSHPLKAHIVISRALTGLKELLQYTEALLLPKGYGVFPKGASWQQELNSLSTQQQQIFTITPYNNLFATGGKVIICHAKQ